MPSLEAYLEALEAQLDCDPLLRDEIRLEVHTHLREAADEARRQGLGGEAAEEAAVAGFGPVERVAPGLAAANRAWRPGGWPVPLSRRVWAVAAAWLTVCVLTLMLGLGVAGLLHGLGVRQPGPPGSYPFAAAIRFVLGAAAAVVVWRISRSGRDLLLLCAALVVWRFIRFAGSGQPYSNLLSGLLAAAALAAGAALATYLLGRRERRRQASAVAAGPPATEGLAAVTAYVSEFTGRLECPPLRRDQLRLQVHSALRRLVQEGRERGLSPARAAGEALALAVAGPPERLAARLSAGEGMPARRARAQRLLGLVLAMLGSLAVTLPAAYWTAASVLPYAPPECRLYLLLTGLVPQLAVLAAGTAASWIGWRCDRRPWDGVLAAVLLLGCLGARLALEAARAPGGAAAALLLSNPAAPSLQSLVTLYLGTAALAAAYLWHRQERQSLLGA